MMITYFLHICLLVTLSGGVCTKIPVSKGMTIPLLTDVAGVNPITLYKNGNDNSTIIALWKIENETITVIWNRSDKIYMDKFRNVWIYRIDENDQGIYFLIYGVNVTGPKVDLIMGPSVSISEGDAINGVIGLNTTVTCSTTGATNITWCAPNGFTINPAVAASKYSINFNNITGISTLTIISIATSDSGSYICRASDSFGHSLSDSIQLSTVMAVLYDPLIQSDTLDSIEGDNFTLVCIALSMYAEAEVYWTLEGQRLTINCTLGVSFGTQYTKTCRYTLTNVQRSDNSKVFHCLASVPGTDKQKKWTMPVKDDLESDLRMTVSNPIQCSIYIAAAAALALTGIALPWILICKIKPIQDQLWKRVFKTYMGKLTVTEVGTDILKWLDKHPEFNYGRGKLTEEPDGEDLEYIDTGERDDHGFHPSENENVDVTSLQSQNIFNMRQYDSHRSAMEEANPLLLKGQAADQSSAPQQRAPLPPPHFPRSSNLVLDRSDVGSSEA